MDIYEETVRLRRSGRKGALATIVKVNGSIPSYPGAKILVRDDGSFAGTIGGGCVEAEVWQAAREVMESGRPRLLAFSLAGDAAYDNGLICGGQLEIYIEPVEPLEQAFLFGARTHLEKPVAAVFDARVLRHGDRRSGVIRQPGAVLRGRRSHRRKLRGNFSRNCR